MAYSYKSSISFGLVYIPITLHLCVKNNDISFNFIDKNTMSRIKYKKTCLDCSGKEVKNEDIVKGYEYEKDAYVIIDDKDFESVKSKRDKTIAIEKFVDLHNIDPLYYNKAYYVMPTGAEQAYSLLMGAMESKNMAGVAKTVLGKKDTLIVLRVKNGQMLLNTLFFEDEIQVSPAKNIIPISTGKELSLAKNLIENMSDAFDISAYKDEYREKLVALIDAKVSGETFAIPKEKESKRVGSLMDALLESIASTQKNSKDKPTTKSKTQPTQTKPKQAKTTNKSKTAKTSNQSKTSKTASKSKSESDSTKSKAVPVNLINKTASNKRDSLGG